MSLKLTPSGGDAQLGMHRGPDLCLILAVFHQSCWYVTCYNSHWNLGVIPRVKTVLLSNMRKIEDVNY